MLGRLSNVLYWLCSAVAAIAIFAGIFGFFAGHGSLDDRLFSFLGAAVFGGVVWLVGRTVRYVLAG